MLLSVYAERFSISRRRYFCVFEYGKVKKESCGKSNDRLADRMWRLSLQATQHTETVPGLWENAAGKEIEKSLMLTCVKDAFRNISCWHNSLLQIKTRVVTSWRQGTELSLFCWWCPKCGAVRCGEALHRCAVTLYSPLVFLPHILGILRLHI